MNEPHPDRSRKNLAWQTPEPGMGERLLHSAVLSASDWQMH
jgi:hypothetical protein